MKREAWLLAGLTLVGLALRLIGIGDESAWADEIYSLRTAHAPLTDLIGGVVRDHGNPLGYYVVLHAWLGLADGIDSARVLSALCGTLTVPLTALLARRLGWPWRTALVGAALVAVSPPLVYLAREARVFPLATSVVLLHLVAVAGLAERDKLRDWATYVISAAALLYLHYFSAFVLAAAGLYLIVARRGRSPWPMIAAVVAVAALFAPYLPTLQWQIGSGMARSAESWWKHAAFMPAFALTGHTLVWVEQGFVVLGALLVATLASVWAPVAWTLRRRVPWLLVAVGGGAPLLAVLFSLVAPLLLGRYASLVFPALALVIALALEHATARLRIVMGSALAILTVAALIGLYRGGHKDDWRGLAARLDGRPVFVVPREAMHGVRFYRPELAVTVLDPRTIDPLMLRTHLRDADDDAWLVLYTFDPRVGVSTERSLALMRDVRVETVIDGRRLRLLHLTAE